jgi:outer membrane protein TolC
MAIEERFPSFSIDGSWGGNAERFSQMFRPVNLFFELIGSLVFTLIEAQAARLGNTSMLFQALGGGWRNRVE